MSEQEIALRPTGYVAANVASAVTGYRPDSSSDCYTFRAINRHQLYACWIADVRAAGCTNDLIADLASRLAGRVQFSADGRGRRSSRGLADVEP